MTNLSKRIEKNYDHISYRSGWLYRQQSSQGNNKRYENPVVIGLDNMNDYYDVRLKEERLRELAGYDKECLITNAL